MTNEITAEIEEQHMSTATIACPHCDETMKNDRGLAIHIGRKHKDVNGSANGSTKTKTKTTKSKSKSKSTHEAVRSIEVNYDKIDITTKNGSKLTFDIEPPTLLHILSSAKAASKEYVESL